MMPSVVKMAWSQVKELAIFLVVVLALVIYIDGQQAKTERAIRAEINDLGRALCEQAKTTDAVGHYNSALDALILDLRKRRDENVDRGDWDKALINVQTAESLKLAKLKQDPQDCSRPLLPERG